MTTKQNNNNSCPIGSMIYLSVGLLSNNGAR